jgi:hypothetical protein
VRRRLEITGSIKMPATTHWDELTRSEQRLLIRLYGGGTVRNQDPKAIEDLHRRDLVDDEGKITALGLLLFSVALRRHQTDARQRMGFA